MMSHHNPTKSPAEVLAMAKMAGRLRSFRTVEPHVGQRMSERNATFKCLARALQTATNAFFQSEKGRWRLEGGTDSDGESLTLVIELRDGVVVVTLF
ncbi:MAG TPA: hypothetical protein VIV60_18195 [Polyangiaceae bacterium]|jgi:hypothetical protein